MSQGAPRLATSNKKSQLTSNILWLYGLQGLNYLIPAALLPYLVRVLGVEQYGLIAFAQAIAQYFIIGTDYGFNFSATRAIARDREDKEKVCRVFWTVLMIKLVLLIAGAVVLCGAVMWVARLRENAAVYLATYVAVIGNAIFPLWLFQGLERMSAISMITGLAKLASAILIVILVRRPGDTLLATLLLSSGFLIAGIVGLVSALKNHIEHFIMPGWGDIRAALHSGRHLFVTTAAISLYTNTNTFLVGALAGNEQAGYFSLADKIIRAVVGLISPIIQASYPHVVRLLAESRDAALAFIRKLVFRGMAGGLFLGAILFVTAKPVADIAFHNQAHAAAPLLRCLALFPAMATVAYILGATALIPFGFDREQSRMLLTIGVLNIVVGAVLIPFLGAFGGVVAMNLAESLQVVGNIVILNRGRVSLFRTSTGSPVTR